MKFNIYPLKDTSRLEEVCNVFAKGLVKTNKEWWIWKHYTLNGLPEGMVLIAEDEDNRISAVFAMQPAYYYKGKKRIMLVQLEDLVIDPKYRGQGLMKKLYEYTVQYYKKQGADALIGLSPNDKSYAVLMSYGFQDLSNLSGIKSKKKLLPNLLKRKEWRCREWHISIQDNITNVKLKTREENIWKMEKNDEFLKWKFCDNPDRKYQWVTIKHKDETKGYIVFYVNEGRVRKSVNICDWELDVEVDSCILKQVVNLLQGYGNWITLWGNMSEDSIKLWENAGLSEKCMDKSPFLFMPLHENVEFQPHQITKADSDN